MEMSATATTAAAMAAFELYKRNASADKRNSFLKYLLSSSRRVSISASAAREAVGPAQLSIPGFCREIHNHPDSEHKQHQQPPYWVSIRAQNLEGGEYCLFIYCNIVYKVAEAPAVLHTSVCSARPLSPLDLCWCSC